MTESIKEQVKERTERIWENTILEIKNHSTREEIRIALNDLRQLHGLNDLEDMLQ